VLCPETFSAATPIVIGVPGGKETPAGSVAENDVAVEGILVWLSFTGFGSGFGLTK
jgi:hypothetical protein